MSHMTRASRRLPKAANALLSASSSTSGDKSPTNTLNSGSSASACMLDSWNAQLTLMGVLPSTVAFKRANAASAAAGVSYSTNA